MCTGGVANEKENSGVRGGGGGAKCLVNVAVPNVLHYAKFSCHQNL